MSTGGHLQVNLPTLRFKMAAIKYIIKMAAKEIKQVTSGIARHDFINVSLFVKNESDSRYPTLQTFVRIKLNKYRFKIFNQQRAIWYVLRSHLTVEFHEEKKRYIFFKDLFL